MSFLPPSKVKLGFWIDWSRGQTLGSTITTDTSTANVIVAITAVVISLASLHLWHILLFSFYQIRSKDKRIGDGLYRQQQALLRSLPSPEQTLWDFSKLGWIWRGKAQNNFVRSFGLALVALIFAISALAASLGSSFIVSTSTIPVLVDSNNCGRFHPSQQLLMESYANSIRNSALDYAKNCYVQDALSGLCVKYVKPRIPFTTRSVLCPFNTSICISSAISMDTGYIDSNDDFGINSLPEDRVQARKKTVCAPIKVSGYYDTANVTARAQNVGRKLFPGEQAFIIDYGILAGYQGTIHSHFLYDTYFSNFTNTYRIETEYSGPSYGSIGSYVPIEQLERSDADTVLVWVFSNAVRYGHPVSEPVFSAHKEDLMLLQYRGGELNMTVYTPDNPLGTVACAEQYQFCVTNNNGLNCTELGGLPKPTRAGLAAISPNDNQLAIFRLLHYAMLGSDISLAGDSEIPVLLAANTLTEFGLQQYLAKNQWQREVNLWESYALSTMQSFMTSFAIGPGIRGSNGSEAQFHPPTTPARRKLCKAQKMMVKGGFANASVFGLAFTMAISGFVIILDLLLLRVLVSLGKLHDFTGFNIDRWIQDGVLQLQRKAYEGLGQGTWTLRDEDVPLVGPYDQLYDFEVDLEHQKPECRRSNSSTDKVATLDSQRLSSEPIDQPIQDEYTKAITQPVGGVNATSVPSDGSKVEK